MLRFFNYYCSTLEGDFMERAMIYRDLEKKFTVFRWILICIAPLLVGLSDFNDNKIYFYLFLIFTCFYNTLVTYAAYSKKHRIQYILKATIYVDIPLVSLLLFIRGGLRSDVYLLYYLLILYDGAKYGFKGTINSLAQSVFFFTIATFFFTETNDFDFNRYVLKIFYLVTITYVMYEVNKQIDSFRDKEKQARDLAHKDPLTNLFNRLLLPDNFEKMRKYNEETKNPFAVLIFDIDNFKNINDQYGHIYGDKVLVEIARILKEHIVSDDFLCRFGGEEFLAFIKDIDEQQASIFANKIREEIENYDFDGIKITISIGINIFKKDCTMIENITWADKAMYLVKNDGKNKVCVHKY